MGPTTRPAVFGGLLLATPALADPAAFEFFGHRLEIRSAPIGVIFFADDFPESDPFSERLLIDGLEFYRAPQFRIAAIGALGDAPVIVGTVWDGDRSCGAAPFVITFAPASTPAFDGPLASCATFVASIEGDEVVLRGRATAIAPGEHWTWRPGVGFVGQSPLGFAALATSGWDAVRNRSLDDPLDLLDYQDILLALADLMGEARDAVILALSGAGFAYFDDSLHIAYGCAPTSCEDGMALIAADGVSEALYVALHRDGAYQLAPNLELWPKAAAERLREWLPDAADPVPATDRPTPPAAPARP